jgi:glycosyltransferase involved in cell wall biosynthesis
MRINIVSNVLNGVGLQRDFELLRDYLASAGHQVLGIQFNAPFQSCPADISIFLEVLVASQLEQARRNYFFPNPEWYFTGWNPLLAKMDAVCCKTRACMELFTPLVAKERLHFTGFMSADLRDVSIPRERRFLHVAGKSQTKNTPAVMEAWGRFNIQYPLTIVSESYLQGNLPSVTFIKRASDEQIKQLMNSHKFHLMPSMYEGFGHVIHEGFSCEAVMITTNKAPMNDWAAPKELLCEVSNLRQFNLAALAYVPADQIEEATRKAWSLPETRLLEIGALARLFFIQECLEFRDRFKGLIYG